MDKKELKEKIEQILNNKSVLGTVGWVLEETDFEDVAEEIVNLLPILDVSLSFEAKEKIIDLHGYVTEIEEVDGDVVWFYDQNGEYMSLRKEYVKRYSS